MANVSGVIGIEPQGGQVARMCAAAPEWQTGDWYVEGCFPAIAKRQRPVAWKAVWKRYAEFNNA